MVIMGAFNNFSVHLNFQLLKLKNNTVKRSNKSQANSLKSCSHQTLTLT